MEEINIRWMIRRDMPSVIAIESRCFPDPWQEEDFLNLLRLRNVIGMVCEQADKIIGFIIYELNDNAMSIVTLAIDPDFQRKKIGTFIIDKIKQKLSIQRRTLINCLVRESDLSSQLFFSKNGFKCIEILKKPFEEGKASEEDGYHMQYGISKEELNVKNRIKDVFSE